jgi:hypothetical protein
LEHNKDFSKLVNGIYEDLTGVVVTGAKKGDKENLYKCIIVGKAGSK